MSELKNDKTPEQGCCSGDKSGSCCPPEKASTGACCDTTGGCKIGSIVLAVIVIAALVVAAIAIVGSKPEGTEADGSVSSDQAVLLGETAGQKGQCGIDSKTACGEKKACSCEGSGTKTTGQKAASPKAPGTECSGGICPIPKPAADTSTGNTGK